MKRLTFLGIILSLSISTSFGFYNPEMGRWLSRDPLEEQGGVNLYAFVANDPVNQVDFLGLRPRWQIVEVAQQLGVPNPETMDHENLVKAIQKILNPSLKNPDGDWTDFGPTEKKYLAWAKAKNLQVVQFEDRVTWDDVYKAVIKNKALLGKCADTMKDDDWKRIVALAYLESGSLNRYASRWSCGSKNAHSSASGLFQFTKAAITQIKDKAKDYKITITGLDKVADNPLMQEKTDPIWETETSVQMALVYMRFLLEEKHKCCDLKSLTEWSVIKLQWEDMNKLIKEH